MIFTGGDQKLKAPNRLYFKNTFKEPYPGTRHGFTGNINGDHIDWILYRGGIILKESKIIYDVIDGGYPSDHYPLYAKFKWEKDEL
jgi:endonuclease/exonuclease/phosphatase family metal-dependent hydrolase